MIGIAGINGNMASRYKAVLKHIGVKCVGWDVGEDPIENCDGYIIATPTRTHAEVIQSLIPYGSPILCEKPISKDLGEVKDILDECEKYDIKLQMISQYDELVKPGATGPTVYDYFKHGTDGLYWDCINIIYHASSSVILQEKSPIWTCMINGHQLSLSDMDKAYVSMIEKWLRRPKADYERIWKAHHKAFTLETECKGY